MLPVLRWACNQEILINFVGNNKVISCKKFVPPIVESIKLTLEGEFVKKDAREEYAHLGVLPEY